MSEKKCKCGGDYKILSIDKRDYKKARESYESGKGGSLNDVARAFGIPASTLKYHADQENWETPSGGFKRCSSGGVKK